jgi:hypothetical protein
MRTAPTAPSAIGANKMSIFRYHEAIKLATAVVRKPAPRTRNDRRAPARLTKKPALVLTPTISSRPTHVCGCWSGISPRPTLTTKADCRESIKPACQIAQVTPPAKKARPSETSSDFHENVFNALGNSVRRYVLMLRASHMRREPRCQRDYTPPGTVVRKKESINPFR